MAAGEFARPNVQEGLRVVVDTSALDAYRKELAYLGDAANKVLARTINETVRKSRTLASQGIREIYNISAGDLRPYLKTRLANAGKLSGALDASAPMLPLAKFLSGSQRNKVQVQVLKGAAKTFTTPEGVTHTRREANRKVIAGVYMITLPTGHTGIFEHVPGEKTSAGHEKIKELFTIGPGIMMGYSRAGEKIEATAEAYFQTRLAHNVEFMLAQLGK